MTRMFTVRSPMEWAKAVAELGIPKWSIRKAPGVGGFKCRVVTASSAVIEQLSALECVVAVCPVSTGRRHVLKAQGQTRSPGGRRSPA